MKDFKNDVIAVIKKKLEIIKTSSKEKFKNLLDKNIKAHEEIINNLEKEPTNISEYIEILLYV